jgi:phospholipase/carboxylesterase
MMEEKSFGPLRGFQITKNPEFSTICMLHGYGASAEDLYPIGKFFVDKTNLPYNWVFLEGPMAIPIGPGYWGRAWFPIDEKQIQEAFLTGEFRGEPKGIHDAKSKVLSAIESLSIHPESLVLGGFSQGSMLSLETVLSESYSCQGIIALSGTLLTKELWSTNAKKIPGQKFFQSHGHFDGVLPFNHAKALYSLLTSAGWEGNWIEFEGAHEIPMEVVQGMIEFLGKIQK